MAASNEETEGRWALLQWGGSTRADDDRPTHIGSYEGIANAAMRPRWVRAAACARGEEPVYGDWFEIPAEHVELGLLRAMWDFYWNHYSEGDPGDGGDHAVVSWADAHELGELASAVEDFYVKHGFPKD